MLPLSFTGCPSLAASVEKKSPEDKALDESWAETRRVVAEAAQSPRTPDNKSFTEVVLPGRASSASQGRTKPDEILLDTAAKDSKPAQQPDSKSGDEQARAEPQSKDPISAPEPRRRSEDSVVVEPSLTTSDEDAAAVPGEDIVKSKNAADSGPESHQPSKGTKDAAGKDEQPLEAKSGDSEQEAGASGNPSKGEPQQKDSGEPSGDGKEAARVESGLVGEHVDPAKGQEASSNGETGPEAKPSGSGKQKLPPPAVQASPFNAA